MKNLTAETIIYFTDFNEKKILQDTLFNAAIDAEVITSSDLEKMKAQEVNIEDYFNFDAVLDDLMYKWGCTGRYVFLSDKSLSDAENELALISEEN